MNVIRRTLIGMLNKKKEEPFNPDDYILLDENGFHIWGDTYFEIDLPQTVNMAQWGEYGSQYFQLAANIKNEGSDGETLIYGINSTQIKQSFTQSSLYYGIDSHYIDHNWSENAEMTIHYIAGFIDSAGDPIQQNNQTLIAFGDTDEYSYTEINPNNQYSKVYFGGSPNGNCFNGKVTLLMFVYYDTDLNNGVLYLYSPAKRISDGTIGFIIQKDVEQESEIIGFIQPKVGQCHETMK